MSGRQTTAAALLLASLLAANAANAAPCRNSGSFDGWLSDFKREALAQGISRRASTLLRPI